MGGADWLAFARAIKLPCGNSLPTPPIIERPVPLESLAFVCSYQFIGIISIHLNSSQFISIRLNSPQIIPIDTLQSHPQAKDFISIDFQSIQQNGFICVYSRK